ncbi:MAG: helix-turn-helix domain-containing protein [Propionibacteriaceae bacterium]
MYDLDDVLAARLKTREVRRAKAPVYRVPKFSNQTYEGRATAREAAQFLNIPESTIRSWAARRRLVAVGQRGRSSLYELAAIYR